MFDFNLVYGPGVCVTSNFRWRMVRRFRRCTIHLPKKSRNARANLRTCRVTWSTRFATIGRAAMGGELQTDSLVFVLCLVSVWSCVLQIHRRFICRRICYVSREPEYCELCKRYIFKGCITVINGVIRAWTTNTPSFTCICQVFSEFVFRYNVNVMTLNGGRR